MNLKSGMRAVNLSCKIKRGYKLGKISTGANIDVKPNPNKNVDR